MNITERLAALPPMPEPLFKPEPRRSGEIGNPTDLTTAMHDRCRNWPCQLEDRHLGPCSTDTSGNCACVSADARWCYTIRYDVDPADDDLDDRRCECRCHSNAEDSHHE